MHLCRLLNTDAVGRGEFLTGQFAVVPVCDPGLWWNDVEQLDQFVGAEGWSASPPLVAGPPVGFRPARKRIVAETVGEFRGIPDGQHELLDERDHAGSHVAQAVLLHRRQVLIPDRPWGRLAGGQLKDPLIRQEPPAAVGLGASLSHRTRFGPSRPLGPGDSSPLPENFPRSCHDRLPSCRELTGGQRRAATAEAGPEQRAGIGLLFKRV
jgi:hypothetical protein